MCGITGWFNWSKSGDPREAERILRKMCGVIAHRGPDDEGIYISKVADSANVALGMRRLSIIDLVTGNQPIHNEDKTIWVICNGEIYNYQGLRKELEQRGHRFGTNSDIEVIVHLYEEKEYDLLQSLRGMFAFALWDANKQRLFLARDRVGKKPLVYSMKDGNLLFGSEIKSLLEFPGVAREVNYDAIDFYLTYQYVPSPLTAFNKISKLPPAHYLTCDRHGNMKVEKYWHLDFSHKLKLTEDEWKDRLLDKFRESVRIRMMSDVPLGAFLSGGVDSSAVVAMMMRESSSPVKTFSIGFSEQDFSELEYARMVARHLGTDHHEFVVSPHTVDILPKLAWHYGEPFADSSALPSYYVAQQTRQHVAVALNGDGGDENFAGYLRYRAFCLSEMLSPAGNLLSFAALPLAQHLLRLSSGRLRKMVHRAQRILSALNEPPARRNTRWHTMFDNEKKIQLYSDEMRARFAGIDRWTYSENLFKIAPCNNAVDRLLYTDIMSYLPECLMVKVDIATMANSLEGRSPFLDHEFMELVASMPASLKMHGLQGKYILKKAFRGLLPEKILSRQKMGFGIPVDQWFRGELKDYLREIVLSERALKRGYFNREGLEHIIADHNDRRAENGYRLWALLMLELWHRAYID